MDNDLITFAVGVAISICASWAGLEMSRRKGRSASWQFFGFLFPPLLLIFWMTPSLAAAPASADPPATTECAACSGVVSSAALTCPHCGHPRVTSKSSTRGLAIETVGIVLTLAAVGMGSWFFLGADKTTGLAKCDSTRGKSQMENAFADAPLGKIFGLKIIQYKKISTVLTSSSEIKCTADVVLNNGTVHDLSYRFYIEDGRFYVAAQLDNGIGESDSSQVHKPLVEPESRIGAEDSSLSPPAPPPPAITTEPPAVVPAAPVVQPESLSEIILFSGRAFVA